jgi:ferredoxin
MARRLVLRPGGRTVAVRPGETVLDACLRADVPLGSSCGGRLACAACVVRVLSGAGNLSRRSAAERRLAAAEGFARDERAACAALVRGEVTITASYW